MAIDDKTLELINADIDGELDDAGREQVHAILAENAEARAMHKELAAFSGRLGEIEDLEPPPHLKFALIDAYASRPAAPAAPLPAWRQVLAMPMFRHAAAFAGGVIMTFALINSNQLSNRAFDDVTGLVGTISEADPTLTRENSISLARQDLAGTVSIHEAGSLTVVDFNLASNDPVEIIAGFSDRDLWFRGFAQLENDDAEVSADNGQVRMRMQGRNRYAVYLQQASKEPAAIHLQFFAGGSLIHEASLSLDNLATGEKSE